MTKKEADLLMIECFKAAMKMAQSAETDSDCVTYTDCAHKLYITLVNSEAFESDGGNKAPGDGLLGS